MILGGEFPPDIRVENESLALKEAGFEIFIASQTRSAKPGSEIYKGINIIRKKITDFHYKSSVGCLKFPFYFNFWRSFLDNLFSDHKFDAIHIHDLPLASVGIGFGEKMDIPVILDLHENWPAMLETASHTNTALGRMLSSSKQWRKYEIEMTVRSTEIITVVEEMKKRITALGNDPGKITVVSNTANLSQLDLDKEIKPDPEFTTLVYAGGITYHRGLHIVIKGMEALRREIPNIRMWIIGKGAYQKNLIKLVHQLDLGEHVYFLGHMTFTDMFEHVRQANACLIPHLKSEQNDNSSPNKIFQYMFAYKPVISSNCNSLQRILEETNAGISYKDDDPEDFARNAVKILKDHELMEDMGNNGHKAVMNKFNWDITKLNLINLYRKLERK